MSPRLPWLSLGIAAAASAVILLEIGLTRIFSYTIWYHFAYLTISVALLGFGASGALLAVVGDAGRFRNLLSWSALGGQLGTCLALVVIAAVPLDPLKILGSDLSQLGRLLLYYGVVTLPFFAGGLCVAGALQAAPERVGRLYFWDLVGGALACSLIVPLIWALGTPLATSLAAVAFAVAAWAFAEPPTRWRQALLASLFALVALGVASRVDVTPAPTKFISLFLARPGAFVAFSQWTPINRVDVVAFEDPPHTGSYVEWGASATFPNRAPGYYMVGNDGDSCAVMYHWDGTLESVEFLRHHVLTLPYLLLDEPRVMAIGLGGGADVLNGLVNGASSIVGVEINPATVRAGKEIFNDWNGNLLNHPKVEVVAGEGRSTLRTRGERFDLIEINSVDTLSALSTGAYVLSESYLYTADAVGDYLDHLKPGGIFAMAVGDILTEQEPPRHTLRLASVVRRALEARGVTHPERHVIVAGSLGRLLLTHTLVRNEPFTAEEVQRIATFAQNEGFEMWHRPDRPTGTLTSRILTVPPDELAALYDYYPLNLQPTTDKSPFFFNFYKWRTLFAKTDWASLGYDRTVATGQLVLGFMLLQSLVFGTLLILVPLRRVRPAPGQRGLLRSVYTLYFCALGLGFILLEISFIQRFVLFLGYPTYSLTVVLFSLLLFTGLGSFLSERVRSDFHTALPLRLALLLGIAGLYLVGLGPTFDRFLGAPLGVRIGIAVALLAPLGVVLGSFFPLGVRIVERRDARLIPWAWGVNGCATVVGTILAVVLGMTFDFDVVTLCAMLIYSVGVCSLVAAERLAGPAPGDAAPGSG